MKQLKNWDNKTWLSSSKYNLSLVKFLNQKVKFNKKTKVLDIGCGRGILISLLYKKYYFENMPIGIDIIKHEIINKKIKITNINALKYLHQTKKKFDLIIYKQSIHFFKFLEIKKLMTNSKKILNPNGKIIVLSLNTKINSWPKFKSFNLKLNKSLKKDEKIMSLIKSSLKKYKISSFNFKVMLMKFFYLEMLANRFTSCLLNFSNEELKQGVKEVNYKYKNKINFIDRLTCIEYTKK